ncbi:MAG: Lrp/AsnC family transcriptional regulator [Catenulispora sp.]|nr:Lrp/AsnC family transcriptional regulator [Catenulispora sp.]
MALDATDRAILLLLEQSGRLSNADLAEKVNLSPSPCLRRLRHLEETGVIRGYHADIDPAAVGRSFQVLVHTNMMVKDQSTIEAFEAAIAPLEEVLECRRMFGDPDYLIWVATADADAYERFYMNSLTNLPGVARMSSQFTMKVVKSRPQGR